MFLNSQLLYDPASLAGRKIFMGWPYFAWSEGYDTTARSKTRDALLTSTNKTTFCSLVKENKLDYLILHSDQTADIDLRINGAFFNKSFIKKYDNEESSVKIFDLKNGCK